MPLKSIISMWNDTKNEKLGKWEIYSGKTSPAMFSGNNVFYFVYELSVDALSRTGIVFFFDTVL